MASTSAVQKKILKGMNGRDGMSSDPEVRASSTISIIGTGDYARALAHRLTHTGYLVVCGSRYPDKRNISSRDKTLGSVVVSSIDVAIQESDVVFVAVPGSKAADVLEPHASALAGKILIDISNGKCKEKNRSYAEVLAERLPLSHVVKAFNTVSAYSLASGMDGGMQEVQIASNHPYAREAVADIARNMGLSAVMVGGLAASRDLEKAPLKLFRGWGLPLIVSTIIWLIWMGYGTWRYHVKKGLEWSRWPTNTMNKFMACTALTLLSLTYLPGCFASIVQLINGTKYKRFPTWLDRWMNMRKQLGLIALWLACFHCILSVAHLAPAYFSKWYDVKSVYIPSEHTDDIVVPIDVRMNWKGEVAIFLGTLSLSLLVVLGLTSLPSVGSRLNWRQWNFVQSWLGHVALLVAGAHVSIKVVPYLHLKPFYESVQGMSFLSFCFPVFVIGFRLLLVLPCFSIPVYRIRNGWERGSCCGLSSDPESVVQRRKSEAYAVENKAFEDPMYN